MSEVDRKVGIVYYPFGLEMEGRNWSDSASTNYRHGFNGKEKDSDGEWGSVAYDYGFRIYDPVIARFLSEDPLTKSYAELTPYQFASNSPISGIDLDGLEYLSAYEARIKMIGGEAHINLDNFNTVTRNAWKQRDAAGRWPTGYIGFPTKVAELLHPSLPKYPETLHLDNGYGANDPNYVMGQQSINREIPTAKSTGQPDRRFKPRPPTPLAGGAPSRAGRVTGGATLALNAVLWGLEQYGVMQNNEDKRLVNEHTSILRNQVTEDLTKALEMGLIPDKYQNLQDLGHISNVILSGVNPADNQELYDIGIKIVKEISKNYRPVIESVYHFENSNSELAPSDNTRVEKSAPIFKE